MPRSIIQTSLAFATRVVLRFHAIQEGETLGRGVLKDGDIVCLVEGESASAQEASLLVSEARQLVENFGQTHDRKHYTVGSAFQLPCSRGRRLGDFGASGSTEGAAVPPDYRTAGTLSTQEENRDRDRSAGASCAALVRNAPW